MAQVLVTNGVSLSTGLADPNLMGRLQVWLDATTVYEFLPGTAFYYKKSTDAGETWGAAVQVLAGTYVSVDIYYERWTSASAAPVVHLVGHEDATVRGMVYNSVNLATGALLTPAGTEIVSFGADPSGAVASVTKARNGDIHIYVFGFFAGNLHYISSDGGLNFSASGDTLAIGQADHLVLVPDFESADTADIAAILYDFSGTDLLRFRWDDSAGAWSTATTIDAAVAQVQNQNIAVAMNRTTGHIKVLAFTAGASPETLKAYDVYGSTVTARTNVLTSIANASIVAISINLQGHVYAFYSRAGNVYYKVSTDDMVTWGAETLYSSASGTVTNIFADPTLSVDVIAPAYLWSDNALYVEGAVAVIVDQYRLMLSDGADPDIPILNITPLNVGSRGVTLTQFERGRENAVLGQPPRAGSFTTRFLNDSTKLGYTGAPSAEWTLDEPTPGLAVRLNKKIGATWYQMAQANIDFITHSFGREGFRELIDVRALGVLTKLAGKKVTTDLYQDITTGAAISIILDAAHFPAHMREIVPGDVTLDWFWLSDADALGSILTLLATEGLTAELYEQADGKLTFSARSARYTVTRKAVSQTTFTSQGSAPRHSEFDYTPGFREIVNHATATRYRLTEDPGGTQVVWEDADSIDAYIVPPNGSLPIVATSTLPFSGAITPVAGVDYLVGIGAPVVTIDRTSGSRVVITFTDTAGTGATIASVQLRATQLYLQHGPIEEESGGPDAIRVDTTASVAAYGVRTWSGSMWPYIGFAPMRDNLDVITTVKKDPRPTVRISVLANSSSAANTAVATRDFGDRITITDSNLGFSAECWIERLQHEVVSPAGPADGSEVGDERTHYECSVVTGALATNPYDAIDNGGSILPTTGIDDQGLMMRSLAGMGIMGINDF